MVKWSKICGVMILSLMLGTVGGCSKNTSTVSEVMEEIKTTEVSDTKDGKLEMDDVILQVGDQAVSYREVLFYVYQAKKNYEEELGSQVWDFALKGGNSFETYAKEELLRQLTEIHIICEQAKKEQVTLTDSENVAAVNNANQLLANATSEEIKQYGFTKESLEDIFKENAIAKKMYEKVIVSAEPKIAEEEYRQIQVQYIQIMTNGTDKHRKTIAMTDGQKAKALTRAKKILEKAKTMDDFEVYAKKKSDAVTSNIEFSRQDMPATFWEIAFSLKTGEYSDVIEGTDGYYIMYCANDNVKEVTGTKVAKAIEEFKSGLFENAYTEWSKQYSAEVSVKLWQMIEI